MLHSLDEDDRSISAHTANLNAISPRASKSASPTVIIAVSSTLYFHNYIYEIELNNVYFLTIGSRIEWTNIIKRAT